MPFVLSESLSGMSWPSNESIHAGSIENCSGFQTPLTSLSTPTSPDSTLKRRRFKHTGSLNSIIREPFVIRSDARDSRSHSPTLPSPPTEEQDLISKAVISVLGWYPCFLLKILKTLMSAFLPQTWWRLSLMLPLLILTMWLWIFKQMLHVLSLLFSEKSVKNKTILISGASSIQALHLARNFRSAGARVVMCEVEGVFALARFSTAVNRFYTVPKPNSDQLQGYVRALTKIVVKEQVNYYIPVCATTSAYYDAVAKPHLELLGCCCFCPGIKEVWIFDDTLEVLKKCKKNDIPVPRFYEITSPGELLKLYETEDIKKGMWVMSAAGPRGLRERSKIILPRLKENLKLSECIISEHKPWVVVENVVGYYYLTCTVVRNSQMIANAICKLDPTTNTLISVEQKDIDKWITNFFSKLQLLRPVTGHFSFRFVICRNSKAVIPLSSQVGISVLYMCFNNIHPKLLWKHCQHSRPNSRLFLENGHFKIQAEDVVIGLKNRNSFKLGHTFDKKKSMFKLSDPFPYWSYYYMHLPVKKFLNFLDNRQNGFTAETQINSQP